MATAAVRALVQDLPYAMRESVEGYVVAVGEALPAIATEAGVEVTPGLREQFLFIVAVRRIWDAVSGQYWVVSNCADIAESRGISGFRAGSELYYKGSEAHNSLKYLKDKMEIELKENSIYGLVSVHSLSDLLAAVQERR